MGWRFGKSGLGSRSSFISGMVRLISCIFLASLLGSVAGGQDASSRDEHIVRMMYAQLDYLTQLDVVSTDAMKYYVGEPVGKDVVAQQLSGTKLSFTLSYFKTGPLSEILNDTWSNYFTLPLPPQQMINVSFTEHDFNDGDAAKISWETAKARWATAPEVPQVAIDREREITVGQILEAGNKVAPSGIAYTRYAAYTVKASFQGKTNTYKAIYLFGTNSKGEEQASPEDGFTEMSGIGTPDFYPDGLLRSHLRDVPMLAEWLAQHTVTDASCSRAGTGHLCCVDSRCGISAIDMKNAMATPVADAPRK
jgi:hypothetical protein